MDVGMCTVHVWHFLRTRIYLCSVMEAKQKQEETSYYVPLLYSLDLYWEYFSCLHVPVVSTTELSLSSFPCPWVQAHVSISSFLLMDKKKLGFSCQRSMFTVLLLCVCVFSVLALSCCEMENEVVIRGTWLKWLYHDELLFCWQVQKGIIFTSGPDWHHRQLLDYIAYLCRQELLCYWYVVKPNHGLFYN